MATVSLDDCHLYHEEHGESGVSLLLAEGIRGAISFWREQASEFCRAFQVILRDHHGTGQSSDSLIN